MAFKFLSSLFHFSIGCLHFNLEQKSVLTLHIRSKESSKSSSLATKVYDMVQNSYYAGFAHHNFEAKTWTTKKFDPSLDSENEATLPEVIGF